MSSEQSKQDPYLEVDDGTNSGSFISQLPDKALITTGPPDPNAPTELHGDDKWVQWLKNIDDAGKYSLTIKPKKKKEGEGSDGGNEDDKKTELKQFDFELNTPTMLKFSSDNSVLERTFGDDAKDIEEPGWGDPRLYLGLKDSVQTEIPLAKAWTFTGLVEASIPKALKGLQVEPDPKRPPGHRNALWFNPGASSRVTVRLVFNLGDLETLNKLGLGELKIKFTEADLVCRKVVLAGKAGGQTVPVKQGYAALSIGCEFGKDLEVQGVMEFAEDTLIMTLLAKSENPIQGALRWLTSVLGLKDDDLGFVPELFARDPFKDVQFRRIKATFDTEVKTKLVSFRLDVQVSAPIGQDPESGKKTLFLLSYIWSSSVGGLGSIRGELWQGKFTISRFAGRFTDRFIASGLTNSALDPTYEVWTDLEPIPAGTPLLPLQIKYLIPDHTIQDIPKAIPDTIERAFLTLDKEGVEFGATVKANDIPPGEVPQPYLGEIKVDASFKWNRSDFKLDLYTLAGIVPPSSSTHQDPALLTGKLMYQHTKASS